MGYTLWSDSAGLKEYADHLDEDSDFVDDVIYRSCGELDEQEAAEAAYAMKLLDDLEFLEDLDAGKDFLDIAENGIGDRLDRLDEKNMIERPYKGRKVRTSPAARVYLDYWDREL